MIDRAKSNSNMSYLEALRRNIDTYLVVYLMSDITGEKGENLD